MPHVHLPKKKYLIQSNLEETGKIVRYCGKALMSVYARYTHTLISHLAIRLGYFCMLFLCDKEHH